jgi:Protein of unknown function (DUF2012).
MKKRIFLLSLFLGLGITVSAFAQDFTGGVKGTVASRAGRVPIKDALVTVYTSPENRAVHTSEDGKFLIDKLADGIYRMTVESAGYYTNDIEVKVQNGNVNDLYVVTLSPESVATPEMDDAMFGTTYMLNVYFRF